MTDWGPKPKKALLVTPYRLTDPITGKPYWRWPGAADSGVSHVFRLIGPVEQIQWVCWLEDQLLAETTLFSRGRGEAEHYLAWWRHLGMDAIGANRLLVANGYEASQHVFVDGCNCVSCVTTGVAV